MQYYYTFGLIVIVELSERDFAVLFLNGEFCSMMVRWHGSIGVALKIKDQFSRYIIFGLIVYIVKPRSSLSSCVILPHSNSKRNM